ncbi:MAG: acyl-CoA dehydrogenase family protein, partial [Nocardioides sp.]|nr:acyl-CoA dehydrogenase family protein [Nocardioides sp.]
MSLIRATKNAVSPGGKHGLSGRESRDPIGYAVLALNKLASSDLIDRLGLRKQTEQTVFTVTRGGFKVAGQAGRAFAQKGKKGAPGVRVPAANPTGVFDLTPTEDEQMLVDVVADFAEKALRPAAAEANETCAAPEELLASSIEIGLPILGVPEKLGGISEERSAMAGTLVAEALGKGDMGLAVAALAPGAVATAISLWGTDQQQ